MAAKNDPSQSTSLVVPLIWSAAMRGAIDDHVRVQSMLDIESDLAQAEATSVSSRERSGPDRLRVPRRTI